MSRPEFSRKKSRAPAAQAREPRPWFELHAAPSTAAPPWCDRASWGVIALFAAMLGWIAFRLHVVGDYSTESDFYGGYAAGTRLIQQGHVDPARYPVAGPGYEFALALVGFVVRDLFTAARLISVASAVGTLALWRGILRRRAGADIAFWTIALLAVNSVFIRYGYSSTTDLLAVVLQAAAVHAVLASDRKLAPLGAGMLAALATLTRYNSVFLLPAALACYAGLAPAAGMSRRRAIALYLAGFAVIAGPWAAFALASGHLPGHDLFSRFSTFYLVDDASRNSQDQLPAFAESLATARSLGRVVGSSSGAFLLQLLGRIPDHLVRDARELLGLPATWLCLAGLLLSIADGAWRRLLPVWLGGALLFATLVPVFSSNRYSLGIAPIYLTLAAAVMASRFLAARLRPGGVHLKWLIGVLVIVLAGRAAIAENRVFLGNQPVEVIAAGRALARASSPEDRVMSRKGQIGYYSGREVVPFPPGTTLAELGDYCRRTNARFLYYSWYEGMIRAQFAYLLDTTATVPGLTLVYRSPRNPGVVYRVGEEFGTSPAWFADREQLSLHLARAYVQFKPVKEAARSHLVLAEEALSRDDPGAALVHINWAAKGDTLSQVGWRLTGEALRLSSRPAEAIKAYEKAVLMNPNDIEARLGLGWAQLGTGNATMAARAWRQAIGPRTDTATLRQMVSVYDARGDREAAAAARAELAKRGGKD